jgi:hypothetical protein
VSRAIFATNGSADGFADVYAYAAALPDGTVALGFRGTDSTDIREWILDFDFIQTPPHFGDCAGCEVHEGFLRGWMSLRGQVVAALDSLNASSSKGIRVTGHSLGAAMANVAAFDLAVSGYPLAGVIYNYGQPRLGNAAYAAAYIAVVTNGTTAAAAPAAPADVGDAANVRAYRVIHHQDPVPQLPPQAFGFVHSTTEVWYVEDGSSYTICSERNGEDGTCSDSQIDLNIEDHLTYMGIKISQICPH